jgi:RNA polymerase sigma-70 factor (ECF subfamily)
MASFVPPIDLTDAEVVRRVRAGDPGLFEVLMRRHNQRLYRALRSLLRDEAEVEDAMQQAYLNAYLHLGQFEERSSFATWLTRIAVHEAFGRLRKKKRSPEALTMPDTDELGTATDPDPERLAFVGELRGLLEAEIDALPEAYRTVFVLREVEGLSTLDTAGSLEVSEDVVKTRLLRAKARLRERLFERTSLETSALFPFHLDRCDRVVKGVLDRLPAAATHP